MNVTKLHILTILFLCFTTMGAAQEINFGQYGNYTLTVGELNGSDLDFGLVMSEGSLYSVDISNSKVITLTGVEYLDVIVEVTAQSEIYLNGNPGNAGDPEKSIPFTLQAAYANNTGTPTVGQSKLINVSNNAFIKQFPILERQNQPPGPPPPPPTEAFDKSQVEETAYIYLFGTINVGNVYAGSYYSDITVTINYD